MPAKITVQAVLASLLAKAQETTEANRQAQRRKEADKREDKKRLAAKKANEDAARKKPLEDPVGRNIFTAATGTLPVVPVLGWYSDVNRTMRVASGDGSTEVIVSATSNYPPLDNIIYEPRNWLTYRPTYSGSWSDWTLWGDHWERFRNISSIELDYQFVSSESAPGTIFLPAAKIGILASKVEDKMIVDNYTFTATNTVLSSSHGTQRGVFGEIFEVVFVQGTISEDPETLFTSGTRTRGGDLVLNVAPTLDTSSNTPYSASRVSAVSISDRTARALTPPSALTSLLNSVYGTIGPTTSESADIDMPGYSLSIGLPPGLGPPIGSFTYAGVTVIPGLWSLLYTLDYPDNVVTVTRNVVPAPEAPDNFKIADVLSDGIIQGMGYARVERAPGFESAEFGRGPEGGTPFVYQLITGNYPYFDYEVPSLLADVLASLIPFPPKFQSYTVQSNFSPTAFSPDYLTLYYESASETIPFVTFANVPANYKAGAFWYDFGDATAPTIPGKPARFNKKLVPLASRVDFNGENINWLISTTYGADAYCREQLLALGFTAADLVP